MKEYLIAIDLDGTLLNNQSIISANTIEYLTNLKNKGHKIILVTGRPYRGAKHFYDQLELNTPLIVNNGATIFQENSNFKTSGVSISKEVSSDLFAYCQDNIIGAFYSYENKLFVDNHIEELKFFYYLNEHTTIHEGKLDNPKYPDIPNLILTIKLDFLKPFEDYLKKTDVLDFRYWFKDDNAVIYEIFIKDCNKGKALTTVRNFYNIPIENSISFGDGNNDIELLKDSGHGVMMVNGEKALLSVKDATTDYTNHEDGVIKYLQKFINND